ncbi:helix-turn-helix transcriptional regulator [Candidatus Saccharibacteria bacterium]|nr:helix-turn-helix transcriptional regulator [Candidatus Saccharibacteria bacterium]
MSTRRIGHPAFELFGGELRTRVALSFIPDPETCVTVAEIAELLDKEKTSVRDPLNNLRDHGLLEEGREDNGKATLLYSRIEHPMWEMYEAGKIALMKMGIETISITDTQ